MSSFFALQKEDRYRRWLAELGPLVARPWTWAQVLALLDRLGIRDPYGFLAAGWWLPPEALSDPAQVERYAAPLEKAIAEGRYPSPQQGYRWEHIPLLEPICGVTPADVVRRLVWNYAFTPGEEALVQALRALAEGETPEGAGASGAPEEGSEPAPGGTDPAGGRTGPAAEAR